MYRLNVDRLPQNMSRTERILDEVSVTELPNLINVLRGDMSLVGPRPESYDRAKRYSDWTRQRLNIKPGITGLAQVHGLRDRNSSEEKAHFDLQYSLKRSLFGDFSLILQTIWTLMARVLRRTSHLSAPDVLDLSSSLLPETLSSVNSPQSSAD